MQQIPQVKACWPKLRCLLFLREQAALTTAAEDDGEGAKRMIISVERCRDGLIGHTKQLRKSQNGS